MRSCYICLCVCVCVYTYHLGCFCLGCNNNNSQCIVIMLLWTWGYQYLLRLVLSFPLYVFPNVELLGHTVVLLLIFGGNFVLFSIADVPASSSTSITEGLAFLHVVGSFFYLIFLTMVIPTHTPRCLICISLMASDV